MNSFVLTSLTLKKMSVFFMSTVPFFEMKGALPLGVAVGLNPITSFTFSLLGSTAVIPLILKISLPLFESVKDIKFLNYFYNKVFSYVNAKTVKMQTASSVNIGTGGFLDKNFNLLALFMFVAIPIPGTGVWGASLIAAVSKIPKTFAFLAIAFANFISAIFVCALSAGLLG